MLASKLRWRADNLQTEICRKITDDDSCKSDKIYLLILAKENHFISAFVSKNNVVAYSAFLFYLTTRISIRFGYRKDAEKNLDL